MGGLFKSEKVDDTSAIEEQKAKEERLNIIERQRRGMEGTIKTSHRGLLGSALEENAKNKLGD